MDNASMSNDLNIGMWPKNREKKIPTASNHTTVMGFVWFPIRRLLILTGQ